MLLRNLAPSYFNSVAPIARWSGLVHQESAFNAIISASCSLKNNKNSYSSRPMDHSSQPSSQQSSPSATKGSPKRTILDIKKMHKAQEPISMVTAYDYPSGLMCDQAGVDMILVGDSLAMVALGYDSTTTVTMDEMLHHCRAVSRGAKRPFLVGDMPFGSYQSSVEKAVDNAMRFIKEGNMESVKLEGGAEMAEVVRKIVRAGIPVLGHIGLTPQSATSLGGFRVQGKTADAAVRLLEDAQALEEAGCFGIVIEAVPDRVAEYITQRISIPTIGIGAGPNTSGQVLVYLDMLGIFDRFVPKFCKQYAKMAPDIISALKQYEADVKERAFPAPEHCYAMPEEQWSAFLKMATEKYNHEQQAALNAAVAASANKSPAYNHMGASGPMSMDPSALLDFGLHSLFTPKPSRSQTLTTYGGQQKINVRKLSTLPFRSFVKNVAVLGTGAMGQTISALIASQCKDGSTNLIMFDNMKETVDGLNANCGFFFKGSQLCNSLPLYDFHSKDDPGQLKSALLPFPSDSIKSVWTPNYSLASLSGKQTTFESYFDLVIVLLKSFDTHSATRFIQHILKPDGAVLTLQNGIGNIEILSEALEHKKNIFQGIIWSGARIDGTDGSIILSDGPISISLIEPPSANTLADKQLFKTGAVSSSYPAKSKQVFQEIASLLYTGGAHVAVKSGEEATRIILEKTTVNAAINPLTALLRIPNGALCDASVSSENLVHITPFVSRAIDLIVYECVDVILAASKDSLSATRETLFTQLKSTVLSVSKATAMNRSSMLADLDQNRETEIHFINGFFSRIGKKLNIPTPANDMLISLVSSMSALKRNSNK